MQVAVRLDVSFGIYLCFLFHKNEYTTVKMLSTALKFQFRTLMSTIKLPFNENFSLFKFQYASFSGLLIYFRVRIIIYLRKSDFILGGRIPRLPKLIIVRPMKSFH